MAEVDVITVSGTDVYIGGCFEDAGGDPTADYIAKWDGTNWSGLGNDGLATPNGALKACVRAIAVNGTNIYVGGYPQVWNNGAPIPNAEYLAKWDGTSWSALGTGPGGQVTSIVINGNNIYVGGYFSGGVVKWDGMNWSPLGGNSALNGWVDAMTIINSDLYVGGYFTAVYNGTELVPEAAYIAKWDGTQWSALGSNGTAAGGPINNAVMSLTTDGINLYVGGAFTDINNYGTLLPEADYIAKWDGVNWSALGSNGSGNGALNGLPFAILADGTGIYVGGAFTDVNNNGSILTNADYVAKWDGTNWSALGSNGSGNGSLNERVYTLGLTGNKLYVGGKFTNVNNNGNILNTADYIAAYGLCTTGPITVQNTNDSGTGSLRQAIADICPGGTINFASSLSGATITLASTLVIGKDLTVDGSALNPQITVSGNHIVGVLETKSKNGITLDSISIKNGNYLWGGGISNIGVLTLVNCVISNNNSENNGGGIVNFGELTLTKTTISRNTAAVDGGGIYNGYYVGSVSHQSGKLTITDSIISDNTADYGGGIYTSAYGEVVTVIKSNFSGNSAVFANGGGIYTFGTLSVLDSTFTNNSADGDGGGIYNSYESTLTVTRSTFSENSALDWGGGIYNDAASILNITNSTFSKNSAGSGGAIFNYRNPFYSTTLTITNSTFSENSAATGGGIYNMGTLNLSNSILANSTTGNDCYHYDFNGGTIGVNVNNLIETNAPVPNNCGTPTSTADPLLGPLADNGGFTQTMALLPGSPAIDAGDDTNCPATDQRGVTRPFGRHCDIGAYEFNGITVNVTIGGTPMGSYTLLPGQEKREYYPVSGGPVKVESTNGMNLVSAIRLQSYANNTLYSFVETMGVPQGLLSYKYVFPTYNNTWAPLNSQIRVSNLETTPTTVRITIGSDVVWEQQMQGLEEQRLYFNASGGPVIVESLDTSKKIVAAIRLQSYANNLLYSFSETMGIPDQMLSYRYYFPTYNNTWAPLNSQIRVSNLETTPATVRITIGSSVVWERQMQGREEQRLYFPVSGGPVIVESLDTSKKIVAAIRLQSYANNTLYSFVETMGVPEGLLSHKYYFPTYNNTWAPLNSQIRVSNLETTPTTVRITIGGVKVWEQQMQGREEQRLYFPVSGGPVIVESLDTSKKIVAAIRLQSYANNTLYSFSETMGIPLEQMSSVFYFPTYNNTWTPLNSQLRFGVP